MKKPILVTITLYFMILSCLGQTNLPIGYLDNVNQYVGNGWAYDQDALTLPIDVHIYIDGRFYAALTANESRPDLVSAGATPDPNHGFSFAISGYDPARSHEVVVYAINWGGGPNPALTNCPALTLTQPSGNSTITNIAGPSNITITTTQRLAGAIHSLTWNGKEFIDSHDHGRQLQSATSFDNWGECYNPTEAGCYLDGTGNTSTSFLQYLNASGNYLETQTLPAFWTQPGYTAIGCGSAINTTAKSSHYFRKKITIGMPGMAHVIKYLTEFDIPAGSTYSSGTFEVCTGYMPLEFSVFNTYDPSISQLSSLSDGPGEQNLPIIFSTTNNNYAMGIYSPDLPTSPNGYGRFRFPVGSGNCTKWNCVFRETNISAGTYKYRSYVTVGSSQNVQVSMTQLYNYFIISAGFSADTVCSGLPTTFTDITTGSNSETVYQWDINNEGSIDGATLGNFTYTFPGAGTYSVKLTTINGVAAAHQSSVIKNVIVLGMPATSTITASGTTTFCQGGSVTLTASANSSYLWSTGSTSQNIVVNAQGSYSVTNINSCGSATSSPIAVTVNPSPTAVITPSGATTFCQGGSVTLTANSLHSYLWSNNVTTQSIVVSASGSYSVTNTNSCGTATSSTTAVTVNPLPTASTISASGATTFCQGGSVTLTASNNASYLWSNGATAQSIPVTAPGVYSVTHTNPCGSATSSATTVTVNPLPTVTCAPPSSIICAGDSVSLTAAGANAYYWTPPTGLSASTGANVSASPSLTTVYTLIGVSALGCANTTADTVNINQSPATPTITQNGNTLTSSATSGNQWYLNGIVITGATSQNYFFTQSGNYTVMTTNNNGCSSSQSNPVNIVSTGIVSSDDNNPIKIYPNPISAELIIEADRNKTTIENFEIINSVGQVVFKGKLLEKTIINTVNFAPGIYLIKLEMGRTFEFKKIIKK